MIHHFGLGPYVTYVVYFAGGVAFLLSIFWRPIVGIYYIVPLIPLQTLRYSLIGLPFGQSMVDIILLGVLLGLLARGQPILPKTPWNTVLFVYAIFTFVSLCLGSLYLRSGLPFSLTNIDPRLADWKNYMVMPVVLLLTAATVRETRQMKILIAVMCVAVLLVDSSFWDTVSGRDFSSFAYDLQDEGDAGYAGVNGLAAFEAQITVFLLALVVFERKRLFYLAYAALAIFSGTCLMYSLSRGGYLAILGGCLFVGLVKERKLLILLAVFAYSWSSLVPNAVQQRVQMTYDRTEGKLDHSAQVRVDLWEEGLQLFQAHPVLGLGFDTYAYTKHVHGYQDSHNIYMKVLVETGIVGLLLFLLLLAKTFLTGYRLFRHARDPFLSSLGLGLAAWMVSAAIANFFGDRWMYLQIDGYLWVIAGLVSRGWLLEQESASASAAVGMVGARDTVPEALQPVVTGVA